MMRHATRNTSYDENGYCRVYRGWVPEASGAMHFSERGHSAVPEWGSCPAPAQDLSGRQGASLAAACISVTHLPAPAERGPCITELLCNIKVCRFFSLNFFRTALFTMLLSCMLVGLCMLDVFTVHTDGPQTLTALLQGCVGDCPNSNVFCGSSGLNCTCAQTSTLLAAVI